MFWAVPAESHKSKDTHPQINGTNSVIPTFQFEPCQSDVSE